MCFLDKYFIDTFQCETCCETPEETSDGNFKIINMNVSTYISYHIDFILSSYFLLLLKPVGLMKIVYNSQSIFFLNACVLQDVG